MPTPLDADEIQTALDELIGWRHDHDALVRELTFDDFTQALGFIVRIGVHAEVANHHPELHNVYNRVRIVLSTHDAGGKVTRKDVELARAIEAESRR